MFVLMFYLILGINKLCVFFLEIGFAVFIGSDLVWVCGFVGIIWISI